jgi:hypothetical protein
MLRILLFISGLKDLTAPACFENGIKSFYQNRGKRFFGLLFCSFLGIREFELEHVFVGASVLADHSVHNVLYQV